MHDAQKLINQIKIQLNQDLKFHIIFEYLYFLRIYKQWILSFDKDCHKLKKEIDFNIKDLFHKLNFKYSHYSKLTAYFFSPHRYSLSSINSSIFF